MKNIFIFLVFIFSFYVAFSQSGSQFDNDKGTSMLPITFDLIDNIKALEAENVEIVKIEFDLIFTTKEIVRTLSSGYTYGAIIYGDYRIKKLKLDIYKEINGSWKHEGTGSFVEGICSISIPVIETANYKFKLTVSEFHNDYKVGHYGFILIHDMEK